MENEPLTRFFCHFFFLPFLSLLRANTLLQRFQQPEQARSFPDPAELNAKRLDFNEQVLNVDDFVANQALQEHAHQPNQAVLHVLVLDVFARRNAVADVQVDEFGGEVHRRSEPVHHFHRMQ
jgi:hypothetical protein